VATRVYGSVVWEFLNQLMASLTCPREVRRRI